MERLLKIVEGPMKGAEAALVVGTRIKIGSGDSCDIVIADASLPSAAFELDVSEDAVTLITPDGETEELGDFEIREFGSTAVAVGPAEGTWGELYRPEPKAESSEPVVPDAPAADDAREPPSVAEEKPKKRRFGCLVAMLLLLLLVLLLGAFAFHTRDRLPELAESCRNRLSVLTERVTAKVRRAPDRAKVAPPPSVREIARAHGLRVEERDGQSFLVGNLKRRTERMAIRALALASDRTVRFDLTDDQSLKTAVADTLYLASGGRLKVAAVTNRVAVIEGTVSGPNELAEALRMLSQDVPQLVSCTTAEVKASMAELPASAPAVQREKPSVGSGSPTSVRPALSVAKTPRLPVAGILTVPYPCVVLTDGSRCLEGTRIGGLVLERITAEELVFRSGNDVLRWRP